MISRIDASLARLPLYRVVSLALGALVLVSLVLALAGRLDATVFRPAAMLVTLGVLVVASVAASLALGRLRGIRPHPESSLITALLLWFLYWPTTEVATLAWLALGAALANVSKYVLVHHARHLVNPAAAGVLLLALVGWAAGTPDSLPFTTWWVGSEALLPFVLVAGAAVLWRVRRAAHVAFFVALAVGATVTALGDQGVATGDGLRFALQSSPVVFFAAFMLTEPVTLGPRRRHQLLAATAAAVVFTLPLTALALGYVVDLGPVGGSYEIALVAANLVAWLCGQRGARLEVAAVHRRGEDTVEVVFTPHRRLPFAPGQFVELDLGASGAPADHRGLRRVLSISSPPGDDLAVTVRVPAEPSAFKAALRDLAPGDRARVIGRGGDFRWTGGPAPTLLVAGGIGVTPFLSQLRAAEHAHWDDVVLVYATSAAPVPYVAELAATPARVVLVAPHRPAGVPDDWGHVAASAVSRAVLDEAVPDRSGRRTFVSGPPAMVNALRRVLPRARFDHFAGY